MTFQWPWQYDFPPFFTLQPNLQTRDKQLKSWSRLVLDYCQFNKIYSANFEEISHSELFNNRRLNRRLDDFGIRAVFDHLENLKHIEWCDKQKTRCNIYWRRPEEWGIQIYEWANSIGLLNSVVTLFELTQGEDAIQECSHFLKYNNFVEEGDTVIIYVNPGTKYSIVVKRGKTIHMKYGALRHEFLIGKRYGTPISATAGYVHILRPSPHLWTQTCPKRTQILYTPDIGTIILLLDIKPGSIVCETGTGSGSLTHALATTVGPKGKVYSYDIEAERVEAVKAEIETHGLSSTVSINCHNSCSSNGFPPEISNKCDALFLDLPSPWLAVEACVEALNPNKFGRLVSFSPCIEQVQQMVQTLDKNGFISIETIEIVPRKLKVINVESETLAETALLGSNLPINYKGIEENTLTKQQNKNRRNKRKRPKWATEGNEQDEKGAGGEENSKKEIIFDTIPFPTNQPTHTGYLTSATLLPKQQQRV
uniref:Vacuolar protein-sorting-associated protein 25 n=2 Tax=Meloidogyne TaxID=189290 RepID=A0A915P4C9_9BILA